MSIETLRENLPDFAKDIKLNLSTILTEEGAQGLKLGQIWGVALACAYATRNQTLVDALTIDSEGKVSAEQVQAAKAAATIMALNNIYYRAIHLAEDSDLSGLPAKLRMSVIGKPGIDRTEFEAYCLAVSAINGCGMCIKSHVVEVKKGGYSSEATQSVLRISAVINATAQALFF